MRVAILDDIHQAWEGTEGVRRLRERAEVRVFTGPFGDPAVLRGFDILIANRERTRFTREMLEQLSDVRVLVQTGNHANHIDFAAAHDCGILVARASGGYSIGAAELTFGLALAVMRQIPASDAALRRGAWPAPSTPVLHGLQAPEQVQNASGESRRGMSPPSRCRPPQPRRRRCRERRRGRPPRAARAQHWQRLSAVQEPRFWSPEGQPATQGCGTNRGSTETRADNPLVFSDLRPPPQKRGIARRSGSATQHPATAGMCPADGRTPT